VGLVRIPIEVPSISVRESLYRGVYTEDKKEQAYLNVNYSVVDDRRPPPKGVVRVDALAGTLMLEAAGTEGMVTEVFRMMRFDPRFQKGLGVCVPIIPVP
jgi:hypothetical protein